jgi:hypothetical protein
MRTLSWLQLEPKKGAGERSTTAARTRLDALSGDGHVEEIDERGITTAGMLPFWKNEEIFGC